MSETNNTPVVFRDGDSWACILDIYQYPECHAGFGDTVEEAVQEYRRDIGLPETKIADPVVEGVDFEYRFPGEV